MQGVQFAEIAFEGGEPIHCPEVSAVLGYWAEDTGDWMPAALRYRVPEGDGAVTTVDGIELKLLWWRTVEVGDLEIFRLVFVDLFE